MARRRRRSFRTKQVRQRPLLRVLLSRPGYLAALAALAGVFLFSCGVLLRHGAESRRAQALNRELQALYAAQVTVRPEITPAPAETEAQAAPASSPAPQVLLPAATAQPVLQTSRARYQETGSDSGIREEFRGLYEKNDDLVGWLYIPDVVNLPVVYSGDNEFYANHDFYGGKSPGGTLFLDAIHPLQADTQHLVIHGHNMRDGTMFGHLARYQQLDYYLQHPSITWTTLYAQEQYDVLGVVVVSPDQQNEQYFDYLSAVRFSDDAHMSAYLAQLKKHSLYWTDIPVNNYDALLTLSTCLGDDRILLVGVRSDARG